MSSASPHRGAVAAGSGRSGAARSRSRPHRERAHPDFRQRSTQRIHEVLGLDALEGSASERFQHSATSPELYFGVTPELAQRISTWDSSDLRDALVSVDVATELVRAPGECWGDLQVTVNGMVVEDGSGRERAGLPIRVETGESR
jgi:crotonobetainyl-CoA:carnitine CoA-transferase CaiB-like acyl-CoA transferase